MKFSSQRKRQPSIARMRLVQLAICAALGSSSAYAVAVPYYSNFTGTGDRGLTDWTTSAGTLTTEEVFGPGNGWYVTSDNGVNATVSLALSGLTIGVTYNVVFDWVTTGRWRGNNGTADTLTVTYTAPSSTLLPTRSYSTDTDDRQSYRDDLTSGSYTAGTGAESTSGVNNNPGTNAYALYYFGHGAGNPSLSFVATATTGTLQFTVAGVGVSTARWDIGNVIVAVPEATPGLVLGLAGVTIGGFGLLRRRRN